MNGPGGDVRTALLIGACVAALIAGAPAAAERPSVDGDHETHDAGRSPTGRGEGTPPSLAGRPLEARRGALPFLSEMPPSGVRRGDGAHAEHRASAQRTLYLHGSTKPGPAPEVVVVRPGGAIAEAQTAEGPEGWSLPLDLRPLDASMDGIVDVYATTRKVEDGALLVHTAKYSLVNHSCGWGHKHRFDSAWLAPRKLARAPLEIVGRDLWDDLFHVRTATGDRVIFTVLRSGEPLSGARVTIRTQSGWSREYRSDERGEVAVQLIQEYFPEAWDAFDRNRRTSFVVSAEAEAPEAGELDGAPYARARLTATLPWRYAPARAFYSSYESGLAIAFGAAGLAALAVLVHRRGRRRAAREIALDEPA
jgi:hypothetical protein